jgi:hypothetical protein
MTNEQAIAVILGIVMPVIVSFLKDCGWSTRQKFWFTILICGIAGAGTAFYTGGLAFTFEGAQKLLLDVAIVFSASQVVYKAYFEGTGLDQKLTGGPS